MDATEWRVIKIGFGALSCICATFAAVLTYWSVAQNDKHQRIREWFKRKWVAIKESYWLSLPEKTIKTVLESKKFLKDVGNFGSVDQSYIFIVLVLYLSCSILLPLMCLLTWGGYGALGGVVFTIPFLSIITKSIIEKDTKFLRWYDRLPEYVIALYMSLYCGITSVLLTLYVLSINIIYASIVMIVLLPVYWFYLVFPVGFFFGSLPDKYKGYDEGPVILFSMAISVSFTITFIGMFIGHLADASAWIPQTLQMLVSNAIFDGFTVIVTLALLSWAIRKRAMLRIPCAIFLDIVIAAILACCSLYFGLVFTEKAVTFGETFNILIGKSLDGKEFELGPFFWTMHTTFLPTLLYLYLIFMAWIAKLILVPVKCFFGIGQEHKNPLKLTAALLGIFTVAFYSLSFAASTAQEHCEKENESPSKRISENRVN